MAYVRETREVRRVDDGAVEPVASDDGWMAQLTAANFVGYVAGLLELLLALRFLLALLGANPANVFASLVYNVSYPFVAPFFSLFRYNLHYGVSRFEAYTLVAMAIYAIIAYAIARLIMLNRPETTTY